MRRYEKKEQKQQELRNPWETPTLSLDAKVGVYARQSTLNQVKNNTVSTEMQTDELIALAQRLGVKLEDIILYLENKRADGTMKHASGRLRIDQREGLRALVERIENDEIKAVIVFMEDRLFRDETQIEVNKFILLCQEHNTLVITPFMTYDFQNRYHVKQFRWKCEQAADFLRDYVKDRLHSAKEYRGSQGKYDGRAVTVGFIIDRRQHIDGQQNSQYMKFMVYPPHAEVIERIFKRFVALGGKAKKLYNELLTLPVLFPDFEPGVDPRDIARFGPKKVPGGYHISFNGLLWLLTNVAYIGWWRHKGEYSKGNHPAIVSEELFWYAFNRISDTTPTGEEKPREQYRKRYTRKGKPEPPALLNGIVRTTDTRKSVYVGHRFSDWYYIIMYKDTGSVPVAEKYSVLVEHIDLAFSTKLLEHMRNVEDFTHFQELTTSMQEEKKKDEGEIQKQLAKIEKSMQATLVSLTEDPNLPASTRNALHQIYDELAQKKQALLNPPEEQTSQHDIGDLLAYHDLLDHLGKQPDIHLDDMKLLAQITAKNVILDGLSAHFALLTIEWRTPLWGIDTAILWRPMGRAPYWKKEEMEIMQQHYRSMPQEELMQLLPQRSWHSISHQAVKMELSRAKRILADPNMEHISWGDREIMRLYGITSDELSSDNQIIWQ